MPNRGTWRRNRPRVKDYWRHRENAWRKQRIHAFRHGRLVFFTRYDYRNAWVEQRGLCGFCGRALSQKHTRSVDSTGVMVGVGTGICPDHDHKSGRFRSLTHGMCNRAIGSHDLRSVMRLADYLERFRTIEEDEH
jgi:hypothetical protein